MPENRTNQNDDQKPKKQPAQPMGQKDRDKRDKIQDDGGTQVDNDNDNDRDRDDDLDRDDNVITQRNSRVRDPDVEAEVE